MIKYAAGLLFCTLAAACLADDDAKDLTDFQIEGSVMYMSGDINSQTLDEFNALIGTHPNVTTLVPLDVPGSLNDEAMIALGYRVRDLGLNTHVTADSRVFSGGVDLFLAGVRRSIEPGAVLGVHSWSDGEKDAADYPMDDPVHEENRMYIEDMLGSDAFYWFTIQAAPFDDIHELTEAEMARFGLATQ